ncbi:fatty acid desaturase [Synechococcus sp. RedBA-s]|uniref:fatty acid desaturase family protein n=1 Tax=Synechococcus sp. RedBA-s TaxID=2823741 RepID=UPI0020CC02D5|nr:fatty acid desaturase [Synechococcus sp. RedBA-s]MCP9800905.1 fatty acid desaturase [Synechococcus sp. RedBA-s]
MSSDSLPIHPDQSDTLASRDDATKKASRRADRLMTEEIEDAVQPLFKVNRALGWCRLLLLLLPALACLVMYVREAYLPVAVLWLLAAAVFYAFVMISTHDISHASLIDLGSAEQALGCVLSWPVAWPYRTYRNLHQLHHRMNGMDLRDPERREPSEEELARAGSWRRLHFRHPFWLSVLVLGGIQLIGSMIWFGWKLRDSQSRLMGGMVSDLIGILVVQAAMLTWAIGHGQVIKLLLMLVVVERVVGALMQVRGMIEHHGLWKRFSTYELTQLYSTRNIAAGTLVNLLMGGLPHHSLHHAYPSIPYDKLPQATAIAEAVLSSHGHPPLPTVNNYAEGVALLL